MKSCHNILQFQLKKVILHSKDDADNVAFWGHFCIQERYECFIKTINFKLLWQ